LQEALKIGVTNSDNIISKGESYLNMLSTFVRKFLIDRLDKYKSKRSLRRFTLNGECGF